jgi:hypothetical protein
MWFKIRIVLFAIGFLLAVFLPTDQIDELRSSPQWILVALGVMSVLFVVITPLLILFVVGIQSINPLSDRSWDEPNHHANPFHFGNPLLFFHFAGYLGATVGLGILLTSFWRGPYAAASGAFVLLDSLMIGVGVRFSARVFRKRVSV